jgi:hemoglobin
VTTHCIATGERSDYAAIGGVEAVRRVVDRFYTLVLGDADLVGYFAGADLLRLKRHQVLLLSTLLGGPDAYTGRDLASAHAGLPIGDAQFRKVGAHLGRALTEAGVPDEVVAKIAGVLASVRDQIVNA